MRSSSFILPLFALPISALQIPSIFADLYETHPEDPLLLSNETLPSTEHDLLKRDGNCPLNYNSCSTLAAADAGACCTVGAVCTTDRAHNIACCPIGATCTGTVSYAIATGTSSGAVVFGSATTTTTSKAAATTTGAASVVNNIYFPFPYIATTYINSAACNSAYQDCQTNYAACTADLQGGGFAVTVVAPGGGITVSPTVQNLGSASATSICSSLSSQACYGIQSTNCAQFGTGTATGGSFIVATVTNPAVRPTIGCLVGGGLLAGLGLGIAGQMM